MKTILVCLAFVMSLAGCARVEEVRVILPDDSYRGLLVIAMQPHAPKFAKTAGSILLTFPRSGRMEFKDVSFLEGWKEYVAQSPSGVRLSARDVAEKEIDGRAFWTLGRHMSSKVDEFCYFVGTRSELEAFFQSRRAKEPNQPPEPTAMSVTPPAAQEPRQP